MSLKIDARWGKPVRLSVATAGSIYECDEVESLPTDPGVYVFYRKHGDRLSPLYVGKSRNVRQRIVQHLNSVRLMTAIYEAEAGGKYVICGVPWAKPGQEVSKVLSVLESGLIDYFMAEGFELKQKEGTRRPSHEIAFTGNRTSEDLVGRRMRVRV
jgi:hypothetical protein